MTDLPAPSFLPTFLVAVLVPRVLQAASPGAAVHQRVVRLQRQARGIPVQGRGGGGREGGGGGVWDVGRSRGTWGPGEMWAKGVGCVCVCRAHGYMSPPGLIRHPTQISRVSYEPRTRAPTQDLEFGIDCDSRVALVGPNGAGEAGGQAGRQAGRQWAGRATRMCGLRAGRGGQG